MISNYTELKDALEKYLNRADADTLAMIPTFISLAEDRLDRDLRRTTAVATLSIASDSQDLPNDVAELRSSRFQTATAWNNGALAVCTPLTFADAARRYGVVAGRPRYIMTLGSKVYLAPAPDQSYDLEITYFQKLVRLSDANPTNILLTEASDVYLYGALMQAEPFLENDERAGMWKAEFDAAVAGLNNRRQNEEYGAAPLTARLPRVF